jgi:hypothetical protein
MDPGLSLELCEGYIKAKSLRQAEAELRTYRLWRARGGYEPRFVGGTSMHGDAFAKYCEQGIEALQAAERKR